jgi:hypothetical protein
MRTAPLVLALVALGAVGACSDDDPDTGDTTDQTTGETTAGDGRGGDATLAVRLEPTDAIFIEGFEVGLRFTDAASGDEIERVVWSEAAGAGDPYTFVLDQPVSAGTIRVGADVNLGIGPGPEPPDLDADSLPCELDVEVGAGETVTVQVAFDDAADGCLTIVTS